MNKFYNTTSSIRFLLLTSICVAFLNFNNLFAQCQNVDVDIAGPIGIPTICQETVTFNFRFTNNGGPTSTDSYLVITADPSGNDFATIESISGAGFTVTSGLNTGQIKVDQSVLIGNVPVYLSIEVAYSCDLWDNMDMLNGYVIDILGVNPFNQSTCFHEVSEPYDIGYVIAQPDPITPPDITVDLGERFDVCTNILVDNEGDFCDQDFTIFAELGECINYDNLVVRLTDNGNCGFQLFPFISPNDITPYPGGLQIDVTIPSCIFNPTPRCLDGTIYDGQFGDLVVCLEGLTKTCCGDGGASTVVFSTTTCDENSPSSCFNGGLLETQFTSGIQTIFTPNGGIPDLEVVQNTGEMKICADNQPFQLSFEIENTSSVDAYDIDLFFSNSYGLNITNASTTFTETGVETFLFLSGNDPSISTVVGNIGDANGDMINQELEPGQSFIFTVWLSYDSNDACLFEGLSCPADFSRRPFNLQVDYNNQCESLVPKANADLVPPTNDLSLNLAYIDPQIGGLPPVLEINTPYQLGVCLGDIDMSGWDGISDHGDLNQCISISSNYPGTTFSTLVSTNGNFPPISANTDNNFIIPPGTVIENECVLINFEYNCKGDPSGPIEFDVEIKAFWEDCPDCPLTLACPDIALFATCPGDPNPGECAYGITRADIINSTVQGLTNSAGEKRAYPCDEVTMSAELDMSTSYSGPISACYLYDAAQPTYFDNGTADLFINNIFQETASFSGSNNNLNTFNFNQTYSLSSTDNVSIVITTNVNSDPISGYWENIGFLSIGMILGQEACKAPIDLFSILDYDVNLEENSGGNCCSGLSRTYSLRYTGGGIGNDFPMMERVLDQFHGSFQASVDMGLITDVIDVTGGNISLGLGGLPSSSISWLATDLAPAGFKQTFTQINHAFRVEYEPGCGETPVELTVNGAYETGTYAGAGSECLEIVNINDVNPHGITSPSVNTVFVSDDIVVHDNETIFTVYTSISQADACFPWIQLEYDPDLIEITYNGTSSTFIDGNKAVLLVELPPMDNGTDRFDDFTITLIDACNEDIVIGLHGSHRCFEENPSQPMMCSNELECLDSSDEAVLDILPSEVNFAGYDCDDDATECEIHYFSFVLDNQESGNSENVGLLVDLPVGFSIVEASYNYPFSGNITDCTPGTTINDLAAFTSTGWLIDTDAVWGEGPGFLPGSSEGNSTTAQRTFNTVLGIIGGCDTDPNDLLATFSAVGNLNCGDEIDPQPYEVELELDSEHILPEVNVSFTADVKCTNGKGTLNIEIDFVDDNLEIDPNQVFKLELLSHFGFDYACTSPITFPYGDDILTCNINLSSNACSIRAYSGEYRLSSCYTKECNGEECETETEILAEEDFYFNVELQKVEITDITLHEKFCDVNNTEIFPIEVSIENTNVDLGTMATFELWCDVNGNCRQDNQDIFIQSVDVTILPNTSQVFNFGLSPADFNNLCGGGKVVVKLASSNNYCLCPTQACGEKCCPCPVWEVSFAIDDATSTICFNIMEANGLNIEPSCVEYFFDGNFAGLDVPPPPYCRGIPEGVEEVCLIIHSDFAPGGSGCDTIRKSVNTSDEKLEKELGWCEGDCSEEWCATLDECNLNVKISQYAVEQGDGNFTIGANALECQNNGGPISYTWTLNGAVVSTNQSWEKNDLPPGEYEICLKAVMRLDSGEECIDESCITVIPQSIVRSCDAFAPNFEWYLDKNGDVIFVSASKGTGDIISVDWSIDGKKLKNNLWRFRENLSKGIHLVTMTVTFMVGDIVCTKTISQWVIISERPRRSVDSNYTESTTDMNSIELLTTISPNPHKGETTLSIYGPEDKQLGLTLYNTFGNVAWKENVLLQGGTMTKHLDMQEYPEGIYILLVTGDDYVKTHKILLTR